ncbi:MULTISPECIES: transporter substrate-binding domain-containing protein [unclassified Streptomyces]|uniref:transporter substrate-binding domain-containing protein n=1 Tax=unclassified Streptomyces TaxID=2593676 RepID=UPI00325429C2
MFTIRRTAALVSACVLLLTATGCGKDEPQFMGKDRINVAMVNDLPGLTRTKNNTRSGFDQLLVQEIKKAMGIKTLTQFDVSTGERVTAIEDKRADLAVSAFSITNDRMNKIDFVGPYATTWQGFLVGRQGAGAKELDDFRHKTVCAWEGSTSEEQLRRQGIDPLVLDDASDCFEALTDGRAYALSTDQLILYGYAQLYEDKGVRVVPGATFGAPQHYGIGLPKGQRSECRRLQKFLKEFVESNDWITGIQANLPLLVRAEPDWIDRTKPSPGSIDARSCRDEPSP